MGALDGLQVLEAGLAVQGPQAAALLRDWGAAVVKVELPGIGDQSRSLPVGPDDERSGYFIACNRGKRSITLDLRVAAGQEVFQRLADAADVVITNFKPGTMEDWGLGYDALAARNPMLIYGVGSTYGLHGPDAHLEGVDLSAQALGGLISTTGIDGGEPTPIGATIADHVASLNLAAGILAALVARDRIARGQRVDSSLLGGQVWAQASEYTAYLVSGRLPGPANRGSPHIPGIYLLFPTSDGWLTVAGVRGPARRTFYELVGRPDLLEQFPQPLYWREQRDAIYEELAPIFSLRSTAEWCRLLRDAGIRHAPVRDYADVAADPNVWANGYLVRTPSGDAAVGTPVGFSETPAVPAWDAPELGQHTEEVLLDAGYSWEEIAVLREEGAI